MGVKPQPLKSPSVNDHDRQIFPGEIGGAEAGRVVVQNGDKLMMYYDLNIPYSASHTELQRILAFSAECESLTSNILFAENVANIT